jgi:hypothetical protein
MSLLGLQVAVHMCDGNFIYTIRKRYRQDSRFTEIALVNNNIG